MTALEWPRRSATTFRCSPPANRSVAHVCRRSYGRRGASSMYASSPSVPTSSISDLASLTAHLNPSIDLHRLSSFRGSTMRGRRDQAGRARRARSVSVRVSIGPVIVPFNDGRFRHHLKARTADRAPYQGFIRFLADIRLLQRANGVQGVAGSSRAVVQSSEIRKLSHRGSPKATAGESGRPDQGSTASQLWGLLLHKEARGSSGTPHTEPGSPIRTI